MTTTTPTKTTRVFSNPIRTWIEDDTWTPEYDMDTRVDWVNDHPCGRVSIYNEDLY